MLLNSLVLLTTATSSLAYWGQPCGRPFRGTGGSIKSGVCVWRSECVGGDTWTENGQCPDDPADVKCCHVSSGTGGVCGWVEHGKCPGGQDIKYVPSAGKCCRVVSGLCPGPADYKMAFCD